MFIPQVIFDADSLLYSLSHFECDGHTVHMLTQGHLPPPRTSIMKLSLFTHVHSNPLSLAARFHWCGANCSHFINKNSINLIVLTTADLYMDRPCIDSNHHSYELSGISMCQALSESLIPVTNQWGRNYFYSDHRDKKTEAQRNQRRWTRPCSE